MRVVLIGLVAITVGYVLHANKTTKWPDRNTMKTAFYHVYGAPDEVLQILDIAVPSIRRHEVLVEVHAASINPVDWKMMQGYFFLVDFLLTLRPGFDLSGKVVAAGTGCQRINVGDTVHGMTWFHKTGSLAEFVAIDESAVHVVPPNIQPEEAAALPLVSLTSYTSLVTVGGLRKGTRVLVLGGSSATGMMALQFAKAYGAAYVVSTCSPRNSELVKTLGANTTVNYLEEDVWKLMRDAGQSFDIVYDTVGAGSSTWEGASTVLASGGQFVTIIGDVQKPLDFVDLLTRGYQILTRKLYCLVLLRGAGYHQYTQPGGKSADLAVIDGLVKKGELRAIVDKHFQFTLADVRAAFKYLMDGHARGKVVIMIKESTLRFDGVQP